MLGAQLRKMRDEGYFTRGGVFIPPERARLPPSIARRLEQELYMNTAVGNAVYESLNGAVTIVEHFKKMHGREPTDLEIRLAATLFIEENKQRRTDQISKERKARSRPPVQVQNAGDVPACPQCGGEMWDNRGKKKNPKAPDFRCKNENCLDAKGYQTGVWERDLVATASEPHPSTPTSPETTFVPEDALPF